MDDHASCAVHAHSDNTHCVRTAHERTSNRQPGNPPMCPGRPTTSTVLSCARIFWAGGLWVQGWLGLPAGLFLRRHVSLGLPPSFGTASYRAALTHDLAWRPCSAFLSRLVAMAKGSPSDGRLRLAGADPRLDASGAAGPTLLRVCYRTGDVDRSVWSAIIRWSRRCERCWWGPSWPMSRRHS